MSDRLYEDAKYYLSFSKDLNAWAKATDEGSYESYSEYLVHFIPLRYNSRNKEEAFEKIDSLVEPEWEKIKKKNSIISYREFIKSYINSSYLYLAHEAAWKKAKDKNRITYYKRYLDNFPNGKYVNEAMKAIPNDLTICDIWKTIAPSGNDISSTPEKKKTVMANR